MCAVVVASSCWHMKKQERGKGRGIEAGQ